MLLNVKKYTYIESIKIEVHFVCFSLLNLAFNVFVNRIKSLCVCVLSSSFSLLFLVFFSFYQVYSFFQNKKNESCR